MDGTVFSPHSIPHYRLLPPFWWLITNTFQLKWSEERMLPWEKAWINALVEQSKQRSSKWRLEQRHLITQVQGLHGDTSLSKGMHRGKINWSINIIVHSWKIKHPRVLIMDPNQAFGVGRSLKQVDCHGMDHHHYSVMVQIGRNIGWWDLPLVGKRPVIWTSTIHPSAWFAICNFWLFITYLEGLFVLCCIPFQYIIESILALVLKNTLQCNLGATTVVFLFV